MQNLKIGSLNINGERGRQKRALISEVSTQKRIDVLFLQKTHTNPADEVDWVYGGRAHTPLAMGPISVQS